MVNEVWLFLAIWAQSRKLVLCCGGYKRRVCCWDKCKRQQTGKKTIQQAHSLLPNVYRLYVVVRDGV
jgi:hypothetical protein